MRIDWFEGEKEDIDIPFDKWPIFIDFINRPSNLHMRIVKQ
jgi:hypothetical protein